MSLQTFKHSKIGVLVDSILSAPEALARMEAKSRANRPAVEAVGAELAARVGDLADDDRKLVGRWVKEIMAPRGWVPSKKGRVAPGNLFSRGTIYCRPMPENTSEPRLSAVERVAAARAILAQSPFGIMTSEELIAERRREFERGE